MDRAQDSPEPEPVPAVEPRQVEEEEEQEEQEEEQEAMQEQEETGETEERAQAEEDEHAEEEDVHAEEEDVHAEEYTQDTQEGDAGREAAAAAGPAERSGLGGQQAASGDSTPRALKRLEQAAAAGESSSPVRHCLWLVFPLPSWLKPVPFLAVLRRL